MVEVQIPSSKYERAGVDRDALPRLVVVLELWPFLLMGGVDEHAFDPLLFSRSISSFSPRISASLMMRLRQLPRA